MIHPPEEEEGNLKEKVAVPHSLEWLGFDA
jgi:hypothetical protein